MCFVEQKSESTGIEYRVINNHGTSNPNIVVAYVESIDASYSTLATCNESLRYVASEKLGQFQYATSTSLILFNVIRLLLFASIVHHRSNNARSSRQKYVAVF